MHECARLKGLARLLAGSFLCREFPQLVANQREKPIGRCESPPLNRRQDLRDASGMDGHYNSRP